MFLIFLLLNNSSVNVLHLYVQIYIIRINVHCTVFETFFNLKKTFTGTNVLCNVIFYKRKESQKVL